MPAEKRSWHAAWNRLTSEQSSQTFLKSWSGQDGGECLLGGYQDVDEQHTKHKLQKAFQCIISKCNIRIVGKKTFWTERFRILI